MNSAHSAVTDSTVNGVRICEHRKMDTTSASTTSMDSSLRLRTLKKSYNLWKREGALSQ